MTDATAPVDAASTSDVMASVDATATRPAFIIADVSCDDAWLSVDVDEAPSLPDWR